MASYTSANSPTAESYPFGGNCARRPLMDSRAWNLIFHESQTNTPRKAVSIMTLICLSTVMGFITAVAIVMGSFSYAVHWDVIPEDIWDYYGNYDFSWSFRNQVIWLDAHDIFWWLVFMAIWMLSTTIMYRVFLYVRFAPFREAKHKGYQD
ncbi:hypothetical protein CaCOL14_002158 [Colletotrichum acutatum]|uniref:Uncharacterized protein n=1 Tax=Glomerella acutata TaxID=27357 RepID=A0AAD8UEQ4_GLOAC|nr:uncharacterized protein BDZ83DRAFT_654648 [Colletotrichum acutatum]KAK1720137.1 hypothetical protein BDZ83DRAFT_654648 [Colletotrichum acutatum]